MLVSCTKAVIDELMLDDQDAMQLVLAMAKTGRISADPSHENIVFAKSVWRESNQVMPNFDVRPALVYDDFDESPAPPAKVKATTKPTTTKPTATKPSASKTRLLIFDQSVSHIIRWLGGQGVTSAQARVIVDKFGGQDVKSSGINTFINEGKRGVGTTATISKQQAKQLLGK